ncbi:hypothetical protein FQA39_LY15811 [Lamprigera yunnana]|nr:hypothetical protein FQA39_LY15811 [Lamprigera yunnana]
MVFCAIIVPEEQISVKTEERIRKCVQHLINNLTSPDHVVMHLYSKKNTFSLDMIQNPKIVIDMKKRILNTENYKTYMEMIILDLHNMYQIDDYSKGINKYETLIESRATQRKKYLIIIPNIDIEMLKKILHHLFHNKIIDVIVMTYNGISNISPIRLLKMNPYNLANKCGGVIAALEEYTCDTVHTIKSPGILDKYGKCNLTYLIPNHMFLNKTISGIHYISFFVTNIIIKTLNLTLYPIEESKIYIRDQRFRIHINNLRIAHYEIVPYSHLK